MAVALLYWLAELHLSPLQRKALLPFGLAPLLMAEEVAKKVGKGYEYPTIGHMVGLEGKIIGERKKLFAMSGF